MRDISGLINVDPPTANLPYGEMKNVVSPGDGTGTPVVKEYIQDLYYALIAVLEEAGIIPDNTEEGITSSQFLTALLYCISHINDVLHILDTTESTTKDTGSIVTEGGIGVEKNGNFGGDLGIGGDLTVADTTESTTKDTGCAIFEGGIGVEKNVNIGGDFALATGKDVKIVGAGRLEHDGSPVAGYLNDGTPYYIKEINIGDWNMDSTASVTVAHGCTYANILDINVLIRDDSDTYRYFLQDTNKGSVDIGSVNLTLWRIGGGYFDNALFDSTSFNRGFIKIRYK